MRTLKVLLGLLLCIQVQAQQPQLEAHEAWVDLDANELVIKGVNFDNGNALEITLGDVPLTVVPSADPSLAATEIKAAMPAIFSPGTYTVLITTGGGSIRYDQIDVTVGNTGPQGPAGPEGLQGPQGPVGPSGQVGATGPAGPEGPQGPQGPQGEQGIQGDRGVQGLPGADGADGSDGAPGAPGQSVVSAALAVGDLNCPYGGTEFSGIGGVNYACNGAPGDDGAPGVQGVQGPQGEPGPAGPPGPSGGLVNEVCKLYQLTDFPAPQSLIVETTEITCGDNLDNDCDGHIDLADSDCVPLEVCDDGVDNNGNSLVDCADPDCSAAPACGCVADAYEPNDGAGTPTDLGSISDAGGTWDGFLGIHCNSSSNFIFRPLQQDTFEDDTAEFYFAIVESTQQANCESYTLEISASLGTAVQQITGNASYAGDRDWYKITAVDDLDTIEDEFRFSVEFVTNPGNSYRLYVLKGGPPGLGTEQCGQVP